MSEKNKIINDSIYYIAATYFLQITSMALGILNRSYLGPEMTGILVYCNIWFNYLTLTHLGVIDAGHKEIPYYYGKNDLLRADTIKNNMYSFSIVISMIVFGLGIGYVFLFSGMGMEYKLGFLAIFIRLPFHTLISADISFIRAKKKFNVISNVNIIVTLLNIFLTITLIKYFNLSGAYLSLIIASLFNYLLYRLWTKINLQSFSGFKFALKKIEVLHLLKTGVPLAVYGLLFSLILSIDSVIVNARMGSNALGIYNLAILLNAAIYTIPNSFSSIMFPSFQEMQGRTEAVDALKSYLMQPLIVFGVLILPLIIGVTYFAVPVLVNYALPKFSAGIITARIILTGTYFLGLVNMPLIFLIAQNKQYKIIILEIFVILINITLNIYFISRGHDINTIAAVVALSYFSFFLMAYFVCIKQLNNKGGTMKLLITLIAVFLITATAVYLIGNVNISSNTVGNCFIQIVILTIILIPNYIYVEYKTKLFHTIVGQFKLKNKNIVKH